MSLNHELSNLFLSMARIMEVKGENLFKVLAFQKVGRILNDMTVDIRKCHDEGTLCDVEGIGGSSRKVIEEYIKTGRSTDYEELAASVPAGLLPLLDIPGLGPKTINLFWKTKGITNLAELTAALADGSLVGLKGIGEKKLQAIRDGIAMRASGAGRMGIVDAWPLAENLVGRLRAIKAVKQAEVAGSLRRRRETVGDVDLICSLRDESAANDVSKAFTEFPEVERVLGQGSTKASVVTAGGLQVDLRIVPPENFGAALLYFTGSKDHNVRLRGRALDRGLTLNEWGLYKLSEYEPVTMPTGGKEKGKAGAGKADKKVGAAPEAKAVASKTEEAVYEKLGLEFIEPELREDRGEIDAAANEKLPQLITLADIRGDLHSHTTASDGVNTIEEMAEAALAKGYQFLAITDHSKAQAVANGLSVERLLKHVAAVRKAADAFKKRGLTLLAGSEVDILADGRLDYEDAVLAELDIVVASPHLALKQDEQKATDRLLRAVESRYVNVIGHPTGRLIDRRAGLPVNFEPVFAAAARNGTALEINAGYPRLDLNEQNARAAVAAGVMLAIDTDAHSTGEFDGMIWGINVARRGWVTKANVINCFDAAGLLRFLKRKR